MWLLGEFTVIAHLVSLLTMAVHLHPSSPTTASASRLTKRSTFASISILTTIRTIQAFPAPSTPFARVFQRYQ